jgi:hypothetical protein
MMYSEWPRWLQAAVTIPHVLLAMYATIAWWPKSKVDRTRFGIVALYLVLFCLVMRYVFKA